MFWITFIVITVGTLYALNKYFGDGYIKSLYDLSKKYIYVAFKTKNLSNIALIVFWFGGFIALLLVLYALGITPNNVQTNTTNKLQLMGALAILLSAFIASMTVMKSIKHSDEYKDNENLINNSKFYLDNIIDGLEVVYNLLKDRNNNRVIWIEAARTLENTLNLCDKVTEPAHKEILEIKLMKYRHLFYQLFTFGENKDPLPTSFFFGIKNWDEIQDASEADRLATSESTAYIVKEYGTMPTPQLLRLHPWSIMSIFNFTKFPLDYTDPLSEDNFPTLQEIDVDNYFKGMSFAVGAKEYIRFRKDNR